MKSYLSLAGIQAGAHRRQNRMTMFCIALSVFLVTGVFSMADMEVRNQTARAKTDHGNWHVVLHDVPEDEAEKLLQGAGAEARSWYDVVNYNLDRDYTVLGKPVCIAGAEEAFEDIACVHRFSEGAFPAADDQIEITGNIGRQFGLNIGDRLEIESGGGRFEYEITGFVDDTAGILREDCCGVFMTRSAFSEFCEANGEQQNPVLYVRFRENFGIRRTIARLREEAGEERISENTAVLGALGMSSNGYVVGLYGIAAALMLLVILAGVLMISGSMNSSIAERTQYFGMLRCIGAGRRQIRHLVRREALNWCRIAIPCGEAAAIAGVWALCAVMHYGIGGEWALFPVFEISAVGVAAGAAIGLVTVLIAAGSPSRKAAAVPPVEAVRLYSSGAAYSGAKARTGGIRVDRALGITRAFSSGRNIALMTGSFALSIVLFLSFSVMIDWIGHALNTTKPYAPDLSVFYDGYEEEMPKELAREIGEVPGISCAYGRMHLHTGAELRGEELPVDLISYEELQFAWAKKELLRGDIEKVAGGEGVMTVYEKGAELRLGDTLRIGGTDVTVEAVLSDSPFSPDGTPVVICSEETFTRLTGKDAYAVIDAQVTKQAEDGTIAGLRELLDEDMRLSDVRRDKREANNTYLAFSILVYGFLAVIAMITVVNIVNSMSMSVAARTGQFGVMRAIGMSGRQVRRIILSEALSYAVSGCAAGCAIGLPLNALFFRRVIGDYWGDPWRLPAAELAVILAVVLFSAAIASVKPAKRIMNMTVTDAISAM